MVRMARRRFPCGLRPSSKLLMPRSAHPTGHSKPQFASRLMRAPRSCSRSTAPVSSCACVFPRASRWMASTSLFFRRATLCASAISTKVEMYSRTYKTLVAVPPLLWVGIFLLLPYALMFAHSFWLLRDGFLVHRWNLQNYQALFTNPLYLHVFLRTARIAASVTFCSLLLGYPLAYYLSFHAGPRRELLYQLVIIPLWVSYLVRGYAWKTILGSDGVLNGFLQY